ncbi:MAG TPA: DUF692 family protein [Cellvibrio sp.]|nr:DUF692 family protein [Cellvibrio sp.]
MLHMDKLKKLGVGINYQPEFHSLIQHNLDAIDYIEASPDLLCEEVIINNYRQFRYNSTKLNMLLSLQEQMPIVVHGLGLSIGSASGWNEHYLAMLDQFRARVSFIWHSEHLGFTLIKDNNNKETHAGLLLPMIFTEEALDLLCPRINALCERYPVPFLIENTTYYLPGYSRFRWDEVEFLNKILSHTECGLLLDIYNFYCNAVNFGFDPIEALEKLQLDRVVEIHVAGGINHNGFMLDVHSNKVPDEVWTLLEWILPRTPNLCAITYEILEQALPLIGEKNVVQEIAHCRHLWDKYSCATQCIGTHDVAA